LSEKSNLHAHHRERLRKEFIENGFNRATPEHKLMELLLFYSIPRKDTNEIAHELVNHFGSISNILDATPEELAKVKGVGANSATLIKLVATICSAYITDKIKPGMQPDSIEDIGKMLIKLHFGFTKEVFSVTTLNSKGAIIATDFITEGDISSVGVTSRMVIENLIKRNAASAIICHNHPNGNAIPSDADVKMTERVAKAMAHINIDLLDHIIVISDDYVSLRQSAAYRHVFGPFSK